MHSSEILPTLLSSMKKTLLTLMFVLLGFVPVFSVAHAGDATQQVYVTEIVPGVRDCTCVAGCQPTSQVYERKYQCTVDK